MRALSAVKDTRYVVAVKEQCHVPLHTEAPWGGALGRRAGHTTFRRETRHFYAVLDLLGTFCFFAILLFFNN